MRFAQRHQIQFVADSQVPGLESEPLPYLLSRGPDRDVAATPPQLPPCLNAPLVGLVTPSTLVRVLRVVTMPACSNTPHNARQLAQLTKSVALQSQHRLTKKNIPE